MRELRTAVIAAVALTVVFGLAYPLAMTGLAQVAFGDRVDGDRELVAHDVSGDPSLFRPRPSVTGHDPRASAFNNLGPNQRELADELRDHVAEYLEREAPYTPGLQARAVPSDAVTTSASSVDPHISGANARIQANRVAAARGVGRERVLELIDAVAARPLFGLGGSESVNVNQLNEALEGLR